MTYIERCLYDYKANIAALEVLIAERNNLKSIHGHSYEVINSSVGADPVSRTVNNLMALEKKIDRLNKKIRPVNKLISDLSGRALRLQQIKKILTLKYLEHENNSYIQKEIGISVSTYWRRVQELLRIARKYFGYEQ